MANRRWTVEDDETVVRMFRAGAKLREIAEVLGIVVSDVGARVQHLRSVGVDLPKRYGRVDVVRLNEIK